MSGPDYPRPTSDGNAIGKFIVGKSEIGPRAAFDIWTTVLSQYANSDILTGLITSMAAYINPSANIDQFFDLIWNVDTAIGYGLDVWGRIVGVGRVVAITGLKYFGFEEQGAATVDPFGFSPFYNGAPLTSNYRMSDVPYRKLIFAKALANICDGSIPAINQLLINLFGGPGRPNVYVTEGIKPAPYFGFTEATNTYGFGQAQFYTGSPIDRMKMTYTFQRALLPIELAIMQQSNVIPKSVGVSASIVQIF